MIVVDTDVIAAFWIPGPRTPLALELRDRDPEWIAPALWRYEFRSTLRKYLLKGLMSLSDVRDVARRAERMLKDREFTVPPDRVLELVAASKHSSYDCEYVALAEEAGCRLITGDERLAALFPVAMRLEDSGRV